MEIFADRVKLKGYEIKDDWIEHTGHDNYIHMVFTVEKV